MSKTAEQFEREYAQRSAVTVEYLRETGRVVQPCDCHDEICEGWKMGREDGAFTLFLRTACERCLCYLPSIISTPHRGVCEPCWLEMARTRQESKGGVLPVVIRNQLRESVYCGACGKVTVLGARFCHDCGERIARWSDRTHDVIEMDTWEKPLLVGKEWENRIDLRAYHPVRLKDSGWTP